MSNPAWPEITREPLEHQNAQDLSDLCARVFHMKWQEMMRSVQVENVFGTVIAHYRMIVFQKQGLPHALCMFFLAKVSKEKLIDLEVSERPISDEIPLKSDSALQEVVLKHSIHNLSRDLNSSAVCMVQIMREHGQLFCSEHFPKLCDPETDQSEAAYCRL